jgi:hypothetical protein
MEADSLQHPINAKKKNRAKSAVLLFWQRTVVLIKSENDAPPLMEVHPLGLICTPLKKE